MTSIEENIKLIEERVDASARKTGRSRSDITIVAVSKTVDTARIAEARLAGYRILAKTVSRNNSSKEGHAWRGYNWHIIGSLQSNKVKYVTDGRISLLHFGQACNSTGAKQTVRKEWHGARCACAAQHRQGTDEIGRL